MSALARSGVPRVKTLLAALLLPLSVLPLLAAIPKIVGEYDRFSARYLERAALTAPVESVSPADVQRWRSFTVQRGALPVLGYGEVSQRGGTGAITRTDFDRQMAMIHAAGFHSIGIEAYAKALRSGSSALPDHPILITFDGARLGSFRGADAVLKRYGFRATMFVPPGRYEQGRQFSLSWAELGKMATSGRWDVQPAVSSGADATADFTWWSKVLPTPVGDPAPDALRRQSAAARLGAAEAPIVAHLPHGSIHALALPPGSADGGIRSNARASGPVLFGRWHDEYTRARSRPQVLARFDTTRNPSADALYERLRQAAREDR